MNEVDLLKAQSGQCPVFSEDTGGPEIQTHTYTRAHAHARAQVKRLSYGCYGHSSWNNSPLCVLLRR